MEANRDKGKHLPALDGLRGLAVVLVFLDHYGGGMQSTNAAVRWVASLTHFGWIGVTLFFVLSGFLITGILWDGRERRGWWRRFLIRRSLRIFPLYYLALLLVFAGLCLLHNLGSGWKPLLVHVLYLQDVPGLPVGFGETTVVRTAHLWSLAVEEQFYLIWPWLIVRARTLRRARWMSAGTVVLSLVYRMATMHATAAHWLPARAGELAAGAWLALVLREHPEWIPVLRRAAWPGFVAGLAIPLGWGLQRRDDFAVDGAAMYVAGLLLLTVAAVSMIALALSSRRFATVLSVRPLVYVGSISYGLYVYHLLLANLFHVITRQVVPHAGRQEFFFVNTMIAAALSLLVAVVSFRFFESPFLRLKDRWAPSTRAVAVVPGSYEAV